MIPSLYIVLTIYLPESLIIESLCLGVEMKQDTRRGKRKKRQTWTVFVNWNRRGKK